MKINLKWFIFLVLVFIACKTSYKDNKLKDSTKLSTEDTDALRYKIIDSFKFPHEKPDTIILSNEMRVCRTDDWGEAFLLKMDEHPYIDSLSKKAGICIIKKEEYYNLIDTICEHKFHGECPDAFIDSFIRNKLFVFITAFISEKDTSIIVDENCKSYFHPSSQYIKYQKDKMGKWSCKKL